MNWTITAPVLSHGKNYRFEPVTNKHHETIIKYCMSKDNTGLVLYMQDMLKSLCTDCTLNIEQLPVIDQVFLLIRLRSISIGTRVDLVIDQETNDDKKSTYKASLVEVQKSINKYYLQPINICDESTGLTITMHYTNEWFNPSIKSYIRSISVADKKMFANQLTGEQIDKILDQLSTKAAKQLTKTRDQLEESINQMVFVKLPDKEYDINMGHDEYTHMLRVLYSESLNNFIELMYVFVKILNMQLSDVMKLTPSDTQMYYQMFVKETNEREKANKELSSKQSQGRDVPSFS